MPAFHVFVPAADALWACTAGEAMWCAKKHGRLRFCSSHSCRIAIPLSVSTPVSCSQRQRQLSLFRVRGCAGRNLSRIRLLQFAFLGLRFLLVLTLTKVCSSRGSHVWHR
jgi:hypothetical protein